MNRRRPGEVLIEGYTEQEILRLPADQLPQLVLTGGPLALRIGSAEILGEFRVSAGTPIVELAQIEGGGEGMLRVLGSLVRRFAAAQGIGRIAWIVHAVHCAKPNLKLQRVAPRFRDCRRGRRRSLPADRAPGRIGASGAECLTGPKTPDTLGTWRSNCGLKTKP